MRAMMLLFASLITASCGLDLTGRWVKEYDLGVYQVSQGGTSTPVVRSLTPRSDGWEVAEDVSLSSGFLNMTANGTAYHGVIQSGGTVVQWSKGRWHKYGTFARCRHSTMAHHAPDAKDTPFAPRTDVTKVHMIISTHLDLGYTDFAWCTVEHYFWQIFPGVVLTAQAMPSFVYSTHPWLLYLFFNCEELQPHIIPPPGVAFNCPLPEMVRDLENMINKKQLVWHAFAFSSFNELLGEELYTRGFDYARWLSTRFGVAPPITMEQVDTPGLYQAQIDLMAKQGVKALYVGQNPFHGWAGAIPHLPRMFMWSGHNASNRVLTFTHPLGYGGLRPSDAIVDPVSKVALISTIVAENSPAYTPQDVQLKLREAQLAFPNAEVTISTFDNFARQALDHADSLPRLSKNIGDTWVRAIGSDPVKTKTFLRLRRALEACARAGDCKDDASTRNVAFMLITAAEHNWGLPVESDNWEANTLSFQEKRDFLTGAESLGLSNPSIMRHFVTSTTGWERSGERESVRADKFSDICGGVTVGFGKRGEVITLESNGQVLADAAYPLALLNYTVHVLGGGKKEPDTWGGDPMPAFLNYTSEPSLQHVQLNQTSTRCVFEAHSVLYQGNMSTLPMRIVTTVSYNKSDTSAFTVDVHLDDKQMSYNLFQTYREKLVLGEALSIHFNPPNVKNDWTVTTLSSEYSPLGFAPNGTSHLHVSDRVSVSSASGKLHFASVDAPFTYFGETGASWFTDWAAPVDMASGVHFNLYNQWNNNWVTGFPWDDQDTSLSYSFTVHVQ